MCAVVVVGGGVVAGVFVDAYCVVRGIDVVVVAGVAVVTNALAIYAVITIRGVTIVLVIVVVYVVSVAVAVAVVIVVYEMRCVVHYSVCHGLLVV